LKAMIARLCEGGVKQLTIDLSKLTFMDSMGIHLLISASQLCAKHRCVFSATAAPPAVQRILEICGVADQPWFQGRTS
jgi:anti-anti-sigma factor